MHTEVRSERLRDVEGGSDKLVKPRSTNALTTWGDCAVPVLYLILRFLEDLAVSGGSDPA